MLDSEKNFILVKAQETLEDFVRNERIRNFVRDGIYLDDTSDIAYDLREIEVSKSAIRIYRKLHIA